MNIKEFDYLIVGAGLYGSTFARLATDRGKRCLVVDKNNYAGGNIACERIAGINVHKFGAHIFHTSNPRVWNFVNGLVEFNRYTNCPIARWGDQLYNLPFNMNTFHQLWNVTTPEQAMDMLELQRQKAKEIIGDRLPANLEEQALMLVGEDIYVRLIKGYTEKQWGRRCDELPPEIIRRLPVRLVYDNNYFNDKWQGIPIGGYNPLISKLLEGSEVRLGVDYLKDRSELDALAEKTVYTGQLDAFFDYDLGTLQWRSVRFETELLAMPNYQGNAVVNYTDAHIPFTRIIEHKHFEVFGQEVYDNPHTVISREYSAEWVPGKMPYYPINDSDNERLAEKYRQRGAAMDKFIFGGRLGDYRYYDMAPVIESVMNLF